MNDKRIWVASSDELTPASFRKLKVAYRNKAAAVIVFRQGQECFAYINQCVHMPRTLDCNSETIFDAGGTRLRCSFHGIVYDPISGESLSSLCQGEKLTALRVLHRDGGVWLNDKRVKPWSESDFV